MRELSFLNKGLTISITDNRKKGKDGNPLSETFHSKEGLSEFIKYLDESREPIINDIIKMEGEKNSIPVEVAMIYNSSFSENLHSYVNNINTCLLYTSDAADDTPCVDLGGRRIIKKICRFFWTY